MKALLNDHGVSLVEIILATAMIVSVAAGISLFAPQAMKAVTKLHARSIAANLASAKVADVKAYPYAIIPVTPDGPVSNDYFNVASSTGPCDCSNVNFAMGIPGNVFTSSEAITSGGIVYTRQTCVNYLQNTPGVGWQSNCTKDTALKQIVTNVSWAVGADISSYTVRSLASPPFQIGTVNGTTTTFVVTVCAALPTNPTACDSAKQASISKTEVGVYNNSFASENNHSIDPVTGVTTLSVTAGSGYSLQVQLPGYFPCNSGSIYNLGAGNNTITPPTVILRNIAQYGSKMVGEIAVANHPVISKIIDGYAQYNSCTPPAGSSCNNSTEAVEIYNPTQSTFTIGGSGPGAINLQFCNVNSCWPTTAGADFTTASGHPTYTINQNTLYPGKHLLILGKDPTNGIPSDWTATQITRGDVEYSATDTAGIPYHDPSNPGLGLIP